jgi:hypothetical protein
MVFVFAFVMVNAAPASAQTPTPTATPTATPSICSPEGASCRNKADCCSNLCSGSRGNKVCQPEPTPTATLTDASDASALHIHTTANLNDTTATGAQLTSDTDAGNADAEHTHGTAGIDADLLTASDVAASLDTRPRFQVRIPDPKIADEFVFLLSPFTGTMTRVDCESFGGTSVTIDLCDGKDIGNDTCTTSILGAPLVCTTSPTPDTSLSATGFVARDKVSLVLTAEPGSAGQLSVALTVTVD